MHIYENTAENINPLLGISQDNLLDTGNGKDIDAKNAVSASGVKVTSSASTYGSAYALHPVMDGKTEGTYWLTSSSGQQTLTFDFAELNGVHLSGIKIAPITRSDSRSDYKISYEVMGDEGTWVDLHTEWVDTKGYKRGEYIEHALSGYVSKVKITLRQNGSWGVTLDDVQFFTSKSTSKDGNYMFLPLIPRADRETEKYSAKDGITVLPKGGDVDVDVYAYHEIFASSTPNGSDVYFDESKNLTVDVAYSTDGGGTYSESYTLSSGSALPVSIPLSNGNILRFRVRASIPENGFIEMPSVTFDITGNKLAVVEFDKEGIVKFDIDMCKMLKDNQESIRIIVKDAHTDTWGTLENGKFTEVSRSEVATKGVGLDEFNAWMIAPVRDILPKEILLSFNPTGTVYMRSFGDLYTSFSVVGADVEKATAITDKSKVRCTVVRPFKAVNRPSKGTPQKGIDETYACTTRARPPKATVIKVFRPIPRAINNTYNGVYYSTGLKESVYQPRKSPLNWMPVKWNGQDI